MPERVFYVWNYLEWGGAQVYFLGIAARIKDRTRVKFVFPAETGRQFVDFCEHLGIDYELIETTADLDPAPTLKRKIARHLNKFGSELALLRLLRKFEFDNSILHIELAPWQSMLALAWLCRRKKVFLTMHNALPKVSRFRNLLWKFKFSLVTRFRNFHIFASNRDARTSLTPFVPAEFLERVKVTYTNVNPDEIAAALNSELDRKALLQKFDLPDNKFLVFCLGQFIDRKGRWTYLEAAKKLAETANDIAFIWISNSKLSPADAAKIESFELGGRFFLINSDEIGKAHLELMKFLRLADVFTLPSFVEGLPISLLEAMALEIPSISTAVYAIPEAVIDRQTGLLIEAGDSDALAAAIAELKNDEALRKKLGKAGRDWVLANFNEEKVAEIAFQGYRQACRQK